MPSSTSRAPTSAPSRRRYSQARRRWSRWWNALLGSRPDSNMWMNSSSPILGVYDFLLVATPVHYGRHYLQTDPETLASGLGQVELGPEVTQGSLDVLVAEGELNLL